MQNKVIMRAAVLLGLGLLGAASVQAQDAGARQRELQLQLDRAAPAVPAPSEPLVQKKEPSPNAQKVAIQGFVFKGNTLLTDAQLQDVVKPWTQTSITFSDLKDVTTAIQNFYAKNHRVALANLPPQDIQDGQIVIEITEGKLGSVQVGPAVEGAALRANADMARRYFITRRDGSPYIDTRPLERGLLLLNELPGVQAAGEFQAGTGAGESNFRVKLGDGPLFSGQAGLSNFGSPSTGVEQANVNLALNNPSGQGDQATLDASQSMGSSYAQLGYALPLGHAGWRVGAQLSALSYQTLSGWSAVQTQGSASTLGATASYALRRAATSTANLRLSFEDRRYSNSQLEQNISDYQISVVTAGLNGNFADSAHSSVSYSVTLTAGNLSINNPTQAAQDIAGPATAGDYQKLGFYVSRHQELTSLPKTSWMISAYGQLANKNLNSSEQIYLGGPYAVRAYPVAQGGGSQGIILSTELQHRYNEHWQAGVFADLGLVDQFVNAYSGWQGLTNANNSYQIGGVGPIVRYTHQRWTVNALAAFRLGENPLYNASGQQLNADNAYRAVQAWVKASYAF